MSEPGTRTFDAVILGAGAAGLMCAIEGGKRGRSVALIEHADRVGRKILISGGGRCNFTNLHCRPENFLSSNPHFCKSALARFTPSDFVALVEKHRIPYHEKTLGQLFCDRSARDIVSMLEEECRLAGVSILTNTSVRAVQHDSAFEIWTNSAKLCAPVLVVATGGLSIPKLGATSLGYQLAQQFGHSIRPCRPALVPLVMNAGERRHYCDLSGVSADVEASIGPHRFREKMLITHRGLSGPAILQVSSYWTPPMPVTINLAPEGEILASLREHPAGRNAAAAKMALRKVLPQRFAERWLDLHPPSDWTSRALGELEDKIHQWSVTPEDTEGFEKAEVTAGGIDTNDLSAKTMESRKVPGLFFIGEVVDVTGHLGGFNFQWAWASGASAGRAL